MCLAIPMQIIELTNQQTGTVNLGGIKKQISTALIDDVMVGDYVIIHVGYALTKLDESEAKKTLALISDMYSQDSKNLKEGN
jgi:hydrogenase expression/formation protein HypC